MKEEDIALYHSGYRIVEIDAAERCRCRHGCGKSVFCDFWNRDLSISRVCPRIGKKYYRGKPHRGDVPVSAAMLIWTGAVIRIFNTELALDAAAKQFIHIAIAGRVFIGFMFVLMSCLQGAGDTIPTMIITVATTWLVTILLSYLLPKYMGAGIIGTRWAMSASVLVAAAAK